MIDYHKLEPKRGQKVVEWWAMVIRWAKTLPLVIGPNVMMTQTPLGVKVRIRTSNPVSTFFEVAASGRKARISGGTVENESPWILEGDINPVRLNRFRENETRASASEVYLDLKDAKPGEKNESAIVVMITLKDNQFAPPADFPEGLQIKHLTDFGPAEKRRLAEEGIGFQVLAKLRWSEGSVRRTTQIVTHNLTVSISEGGIMHFSAV